ncbi:GMC family oxidoreductase N-terminal domain-containing protein [Pseudonocardia sp. CA-142604]|uniref:GMC family oxidoreductase N-terminal domain-containing protein n=1 Tax=Pseudonocardia sp. CA-142604 TaxID=3240024 RepID=UPI003D91DF4E
MGWYGVNIVDGERLSVADAYLRPHFDRAGLTATADAMALRLLLDGDRCAGVEYRVESEIRRAHAEREVVVCAGVIGSPAAAHGVGHRPGRAPASGGRAGDRRAVRSGREPARPPAERHRLCRR